jgi:O-antigen ligase
LILLAIGILMSRSFQWGVFFTRNLALVSFLLFALLSVFWSDFPFVAFKRWFRDLGNYLVILVVLSDPHPLEAVRATLRRLCYLLIPLSVVLVKYYPEMGKHYDSWTGIPEYAGVTTSKNMLGVACLISGLFFFWDTVTRWSNRKERRTRRLILVNIAFIAATLWLLNLSNSATSHICLALGCLVIAAAHSRMFQRHPGLLKGLIPACVCLYMILAFGFNINGDLAGAVGRDPTLTGRTHIWDTVLSMHTNPLVGTGYESFWLGPRLQKVWREAGGITEAHNGYLEVYLTLGFIGLFLLVVFLIASYRAICKRLRSPSSFGSLPLALWTILLFYNVTESAFRGQLMWVIFLFGAIIVAPAARARGVSRAEGSSLEAASQSRLREAVIV